MKLQAKRAFRRPAKTSTAKNLLIWSNGLLSDPTIESQVLIFSNLVTRLLSFLKLSTCLQKKLHLSRLPLLRKSSIKETLGSHRLKSMWMSFSSRTITLKLLSYWRRTGVSETNGSHPRSNTNPLPHFPSPLSKNHPRRPIRTTTFGTGAKAVKKTNQFLIRSESTSQTLRFWAKPKRFVVDDHAAQ